MSEIEAIAGVVAVFAMAYYILYNHAPDMQYNNENFVCDERKCCRCIDVCDGPNPQFGYLSLFTALGIALVLYDSQLIIDLLLPARSSGLRNTEYEQPTDSFDTEGPR